MAGAAVANIEMDMVPDNAGNSGGPNNTAPGVANTEVCDANLVDFADTTGDDAWDASDFDPPGVVHLLDVSAEDTGTGSELEGSTVTMTSTSTGSITDAMGATRVPARWPRSSRAMPSSTSPPPPPGSRP